MIPLLGLLLSLVLSSESQAASLRWENQALAGSISVEKSSLITGPFTLIATVPAGTTMYMLTPGSFGFYRVGVGAAYSNVVQFSLDLYTGGLEDRVTALEAQVVTLLGPPVIVLPPATTTLLTARQIDSTHVELTCAGTSMRTTGSGLRRIVECLP